MTYLLDTNIIIRIAQGRNQELSAQQLTILQTDTNAFVVSAATILELVMLQRGGRFQLADARDFEEALRDLLSSQGVKVLEISSAHCWRTTSLPNQVGHNDPMDLLILAQAMHENLPVLSTDSKFTWYVPHGLRLID